MGVKTAQLAKRKGSLAGARIVRDGYQVMLISDGGTVIRMPVDGIRRSGRSTEGVIVMRLRDGEQVSSLAPWSSLIGTSRRRTATSPPSSRRATFRPARPSQSRAGAIYVVKRGRPRSRRGRYGVQQAG